MKTLFSHDTEQPVRPPDFYLIYAREVRKMPEGWRWFKLDCSKKVPEGFLKIEGAVAPPDSNGWRKREIGSEVTFLVDFEKFRAWVESYSAEQGKCPTCWNSGLELAGSHITNGNTYRPCSRCAKKKVDAELATAAAAAGGQG